MDLQSVEKAYRRLARSYDLYFGAIFHPGRQAIVARLNLNPGDTLLEVGVGTGLSLPLYPRNITIYGIDLSEPMLEKAREKKKHYALNNVASLECMDAEHMRFADDSFDVVVAAYVATVVPNPPILIDEMRRVCKPKGELVILNHFHSENPIVALIEKALSPLSGLVGFRPHMRQRDFEEQTHLEIIEQRQVNLFKYWTMLRCRNNKETLATAD